MQVISEAHNGESGGHFSNEVTYKKILQEGPWWQTLIADVRSFC
ncbi:integrase zinc binding domain-containing protein [Enterobacter cloacae complex sp. 4DZ1-17B1]|nr:integrase zinc binding domain-containing protein [Enterobacter cloacae complex sp. 4DZ1-17B1]